MKSIICTMIKDEHLYIREWVEHNLSIGFDTIYLYEDYGSESHREILDDYIVSGRVKLKKLDEMCNISQRNNLIGNSTQSQLFYWFYNECKNKRIEADWVGFFDVDEFLFFEDNWTLKKIEEAFKNFAGIKICWVMYGANGHIKRPQGKVVENYTSHMPLTYTFDGVEWHHKSLVNINKADKFYGVHTVVEGEVYPNFTEDNFDSYTCYSKCFINHYYTKSWQDYCERMQRKGNMGNNIRCYDAFFTCSPEFAGKEKEMLEYLRWNTSNLDTMWISHKHHIISGGNVKKLRQS